MTEPRWVEWARYIAPLVNDGLIDTPNERNVPDKAFAIARLLDDVLPALRPSVEPGLDKAAKSLIRGAISDAMAEAKDNGESVAYSAYDAARRVLEVLEGYGIRLLPTQASDSPEKP